MRIKISLTILLLLVTQFAFSQSVFKRKTDYSVPEVKEWVEKYGNQSTWKGLLLYQGSDTATHHFISRWMDEWVWFKIKRSDLSVKDERQYRTTSSAPLGYYYVDAIKDFAKIKDY